MTVFSVLLLANATVCNARAQCVQDVARVNDPIGAVGFQFGKDMGVSKDRMIVGAFPDATLGGAMVYRRELAGTWTLESRLYPDDPAAPGGFGRSVDISGSTAIVGAWSSGGSGPGSGRAYVYERLDGEWTLTHTLADESATSSLFGWAVAIDGDVIVVGAKGDINTPGRVFIFRRFEGTFQLEQGLSAPSPNPGDSFGYTADVFEDLILVGNLTSPANGFAHAYRFDGSSWAHEWRFDPANAGSGGEVDAGPNLALIGDTILRHSGGVWTIEGTVADGDGGDITADFALIGLRDDDDLAKDAGAAILYRFDGSAWIEVEKFYASDGEMNENFGHAVALEGDRAFVSALFGDGVVNGSGVVYEFDVSNCLPGEPCAADCNADGALNIFDFLCFQGKVTTGDPAADCNGDTVINIFDFLCFQGLVSQGCG